MKKRIHKISGMITSALQISMMSMAVLTTISGVTYLLTRCLP